MTTSTKRPDGGEWKLVPSTEFDRFKREAEALARCCDYNVREAFVIAAGALDRAMKSTPTNESPAPQAKKDNPMATILHDSDCAVHNEPAYPNGPCDCGAAPQPPVEGLREALEPWRDELTEIIGHLGAAIIQSTASDDQIIMDHVKAAHEIAKIVRRKA